MPATSMPAVDSVQEMTELQLHMSPVARSSRPQTSVGTRGSTSKTRRATTASSVSRIGLATAYARSGTTPSRQRRIS